MPGLVPGIHVLCRNQARKAWMGGGGAGSNPGHDEKPSPSARAHTPQTTPSGLERVKKTAQVAAVGKGAALPAPFNSRHDKTRSGYVIDDGPRDEALGD